MRHSKASLLAALGAAALLGQPAPASAAAFAGIDANNFWLSWSNGMLSGGTQYISVMPGNVPLPEMTLVGLSVSSETKVIGNAHASVSFYPGQSSINAIGDSFNATLLGNVTAEPSGYAYLAMEVSFTVKFTNTTGLDFSTLWVQTVYSAFNPGGTSTIGASVDNKATEFARFHSYQIGSGIGDDHDCDTRVPWSSYNWGYVPPSGVACGVWSPDHSMSDIALKNFGPGAVAYKTFTIGLVAEVSSVPEPSSLALGGTALLGVWSAARQGSRRAARQGRVS